MVKKKFDSKLLDKILTNMINTVGNSKDEIFQIGEQCRQDFESISDEIKAVKLLVLAAIDDSDRLEGLARQSRNRLSEVSRNFVRFSEEEVRRLRESSSDTNGPFDESAAGKIVAKPKR